MSPLGLGTKERESKYQRDSDDKGDDGQAHTHDTIMSPPRSSWERSGRMPGGSSSWTASG